MLLAPAAVHTVKHRSPVLRLRAARTGMEGKNGVVSVIFARKQNFDALALLLLADKVKLRKRLLQNAVVILLQGKLGEGDSVLKTGANGVIIRQGFLVSGKLLGNLAAALLVAPEILGVGQLLKLLRLGAKLVNV